MSAVRSFRLRVVVSTDVLARGVDLDRVNLVVNADLPREAATYMHRVGRTGRFGSRGVCVSLVGEAELRRLSVYAQEVRGAGRGGERREGESAEGGRTLPALLCPTWLVCCGALCSTTWRRCSRCRMPSLRTSTGRCCAVLWGRAVREREVGSEGEAAAQAIAVGWPLQHKSACSPRLPALHCLAYGQTMNAGHEASFCDVPACCA